MKKLFLLFICLTVNSICYAQTSMDWTHKCINNGLGTAITQNFKCSNGDLLTSGFNTSNSCDIDFSAGTNDPGIGHFLAKYDVSGNLIFGHTINYSAVGNTASSINIIGIGNDNHFYCSNYGTGSIDLDTIPSSGEFTQTNQAGFFAYDNLGNYNWGFIFPQEIYIHNCVVQTDKSIIMLCQVNSSNTNPIDIDPGPGVFLFNHHTTLETFIAKFDSAGNFITAIPFLVSPGNYPNTCYPIMIQKDNNDNIYFLTYFEGTVDFDPGAGVYNLTGGSGQTYQDRCLVKLDSALNFVFALKFTGEYGFTIKTDPSNNLFLVGSGESSFDIDPSPGVTTLGAANTFTLFIAKFSPTGTIDWAKSAFGGSLNNSSMGIIDFLNDGSFYCDILTGDSIYQNTFGLPKIYSTKKYTYTTGLMKLDSSGNALYYLETNPNTNENLQAPTICFADSSHFYFIGRLYGVADVEIGPGITTYSNSAGANDEFFIGKYTLNYPVNSITGKAFIDVNYNGAFNATDYPLPNAIIEVAPTQQYSSTDKFGDFNSYVNQGNYTLSIPNFPPCLLNPSPLLNTANFTGANQLDVGNNFAFVPNPAAQDVSVVLTGYGAARPGFDYSYNITFTNNGNTAQSGLLHLVLDSALTFISTSLTPSVINGNLFEWNYATLNPFESRNITINTSINGTTPIGYIINSFSNISASVDVDSLNNLDSSLTTVTGSYDPNIKQVLPEGDITTLDIANENYLTYTINFQNTGNDTAFCIVLLDTLSNLFNIPSFEIIASSNPYEFKLYNNNLAEFKFNNILLPDSSTNEIASHGFIKYKIKPKNNLIAGDVIENKAFIYFDYNLPIETNITQTNIVNPASIKELQSAEISIYPNPAKSILSLISDNKQNIEILNLVGEKVFESIVPSGKSTINISSLPSGVYLLNYAKGYKKIIKL